ncbi:HD domain-containing protein [Paraburkholderia sp. SIMBA_030]|uniref:HD domain-containing protein n=1 Tax=Paraburkholderia sp. SIMBA_030 TaxID=3085773 RepID=UPI00397C74D6
MCRRLPVKTLARCDGATAEMVAAAWLHDVAEDTAVPLSLIHTEFRAQVARLVDELTAVSTPADGDRAARKALRRCRCVRRVRPIQRISPIC